MQHDFSSFLKPRNKSCKQSGVCVYASAKGAKVPFRPTTVPKQLDCRCLLSQISRFPDIQHRIPTLPSDCPGDAIDKMLDQPRGKETDTLSKCTHAVQQACSSCATLHKAISRQGLPKGYSKTGTLDQCHLERAPVRRQLGTIDTTDTTFALSQVTKCMCRLR